MAPIRTASLRLLQACFLTVWLVPAHGAAEVVTLSDLERRALQSSTARAEQAAQERRAQAETDRASSAYYPRLALKAESTVSPGRQLVTVRDVDGDEYLVQGARSVTDSQAFAGQLRHGLELDAQAKLYDFGRTASTIAAARAGQASERAQRDVRREQTLRAVQAAYLAWLAAHQLAAFAEQVSHEAEQRTLRMADLIAQGVRPQGELNPARADELLTKLERERARADLASARLGLERAVGEALPSDAEPELALLGDAVPQAGSGSPHADAVERALEKQRDAAKALARMHAKARAPELSTALTAGVRLQTTTVFPIYGAGLAFSWPLYDGGLTSATSAAARASADALQAQITTHRTEQEMVRRQADLDLTCALERLDLAQDLLEISTTRLSEADAGYGLGVFTIDQVGAARAMVRRAQTEILLAKVARVEARLRGAAATRATAAP